MDSAPPRAIALTAPVPAVFEDNRVVTFPNRILLSTGNAHKARELSAILTPLLPDSTRLITLADLDLSAPPDDIESRDTFAANAISKAAWYRDITKMACIADDSGLCVDALAGRPGIRSARWAGPTDSDRNAALLSELTKCGAVGPSERTARFVCAAAFADESENQTVALGSIAGVIAQAVSGESGFGYDPLFFLPDRLVTVAELGEELKNQISHRAQAMKLLITRIRLVMQ